MSDGRIRLAHVTIGLSRGGAEMVLLRVVLGLDPARYDQCVLSLMDGGPLAAEIESAGIPVTSLGMRRGRLSASALAGMARWLRSAKPDVVQTWMYHADLLAGGIARAATDARIVWNVQHGAPVATDPLTTRIAARLAGAVSRGVPHRIVACGPATRLNHVAIGYDAARTVVIPNSVDPRRFQPDAAARRRVREELDVPYGAPLIGMVARFHPNKDHQTFVRAAHELHGTHPDARFLLCGRELTPANQQLAGWIGTGTLRDRFILAGERADIPAVVAALDVFTLSSTIEGLPVSLGEAMAAGVPAVVTDAGDSAFVLGDAGVVVPARDPAALAAGWRRLAEMSADERSALGAIGRRRILEAFTTERMVASYDELYRSLADAHELRSAAAHSAS